MLRPLPCASTGGLDAHPPQTQFNYSKTSSNHTPSGRSHQVELKVCSPGGNTKKPIGTSQKLSVITKTVFHMLNSMQQYSTAQKKSLCNDSSKVSRRADSHQQPITVSTHVLFFIMAAFEMHVKRHATAAQGPQRSTVKRQWQPKSIPR